MGFEDEDLDWVEAEAPARRFRKSDLLVLALDAVSGVAIALTNTLTTARNLAGMHVNYLVDRDLFHEEAALELETLIAEEVEDE